MSIKKTDVIAIVGPTASGKSSLAVALAKQLNGEIISADSRQVYRGMDIGTGKIKKRERKGVPHYLFDVASPKSQYTVSHFLRDGKRIIAKINQKGRIPILVGGTGFWIDALLQGRTFPNVKPNLLLRKKLAKKTTKQLFRMLLKKDFDRATAIDQNNPHRLVRALEIIDATRKPIPKPHMDPKYNSVYIGMQLPKPILYKRIHNRLKTRIRKGMIAEVRKLHAAGVSWKRLDDFGLEYRFVSQYLQQKISKRQMTEELEKAIRHYAKRQMTWFKRNPSIYWIRNIREAMPIIRKRLKPNTTVPGLMGM